MGVLRLIRFLLGRILPYVLTIALIASCGYAVTRTGWYQNRRENAIARCYAAQDVAARYLRFVSWDEPDAECSRDMTPYDAERTAYIWRIWTDDAIRQLSAPDYWEWNPYVDSWKQARRSAQEGTQDPSAPDTASPCNVYARHGCLKKNDDSIIRGDTAAKISIV